MGAEIEKTGEWEGQFRGKMTNGELVRRGREALERRGVPGAETDAWLLYSHVSGMNRAEYYLRREETAPPEWQERYLAEITVRGRRMPLQQITGEQEFMGLPFSVSGDVLIPRQDTETLVETVLPLCRGRRVLDLCTGSGCIAISLAVLGNPQCCVGVDVSPEALAVAAANDRKLGGGVTFLEGDLFESVSGTFDVIVSNPPYIPTSDIQGLDAEVREWEPRLALDGGEDGLSFYRRIVEESGEYLAREGILALEIGYDQREPVMEYMDRSGFTRVQCRKDYAGLDRVVWGIYGKRP